jgi:hypothetical protein
MIDPTFRSAPVLEVSEFGAERGGVGKAALELAERPYEEILQGESTLAR